MQLMEAHPPKPEEDPRSIHEIAQARAKDASNRLNMGVSSVVSWHWENKQGIPSFEAMLGYSNHAIDEYCKHYHKARDLKKKSNIFSDITAAFARYRGLMLVADA